MSFFDIIALGVIAIFIITSLMNGLLAEVLSFARWIIAFIVGRLCATPLAETFLTSIQPPQAAYAVAFIIIFILVFILMRLLQNLFSTALKALGLSALNRILGGVFGAAKGVILVTIIVAACAYTDLPKKDDWQNAVSAPFFEQLASLAIPYIANHISHATPYIQPSSNEKE